MPRVVFIRAIANRGQVGRTMWSTAQQRSFPGKYATYWQFCSVGKGTGSRMAISSMVTFHVRDGKHEEQVEKS
jgi:hypothetical protein